MIQNIKFKLCKSFNQIEFEVSDLSQLDRELIEDIYDMLPEYEGKIEPTAATTTSIPSEAQLNYAKSLGIDTKGMSREEVRLAIQKKKKA